MIPQLAKVAKCSAGSGCIDALGRGVVDPSRLVHETGLTGTVIT